MDVSTVGSYQSNTAYLAENVVSAKNQEENNYFLSEASEEADGSIYSMNETSETQEQDLAASLTDLADLLTEDKFSDLKRCGKFVAAEVGIGVCAVATGTAGIVPSLILGTVAFNKFVNFLSDGSPLANLINTD